MTATMIDLNETPHATKPGYILFVLYAPGAYAPCPSVFLTDLLNGATPAAMHFTALYEAVAYVDEMSWRRLIGKDTKLFIRNHEGFIVWRNDAMRESASRYLESLKEGDAA